MKLLRQITIILSFAFLGEILNKLVGIPIPGNILGMFLLLLSLLTGIVKLQQIEETSRFLLDHMAVLFVPAGVGLISVIGIIKDTWWILLLIAVSTTFLVMSVTGLVVKYTRR
ncbi:MAG: murein hydrolase transporter LrgA [Clostridiales bacterium GWB2_37_7]|nr:MAG: murein hydrolase transporter LrgA [Clostridiales bacterium GWB2_37_7]